MAKPRILIGFIESLYELEATPPSRFHLINKLAWTTTIRYPVKWVWRLAPCGKSAFGQSSQRFAAPRG